MIPLAIPHLAGNEAKYLQECVETNFVSTVGPFVARFEDMVAEASALNTQSRQAPEQPDSMLHSWHSESGATTS